VARWQDRVDRAAERHGQERASAEERHQAYQQQQAAAGRGEGPRPGHRPAPPPDQAATTRKAAAQLDRLQARRDAAAAAVASARAARDPVANLTDPDSGWMPTGKGWIQGYNTQLAVSQDQIVLGVKVSNATVDVDQFEPMLAAAALGSMPRRLGQAAAAGRSSPPFERLSTRRRVAGRRLCGDEGATPRTRRDSGLSATRCHRRTGERAPQRPARATAIFPPRLVSRSGRNRAGRHHREPAQDLAISTLRRRGRSPKAVSPRTGDAFV
jgi:hypothetical protein